MGEFSISHWLVVLAIILMFWFGKGIRPFRQGPRGGPPTHPVPVTGPVETSRQSQSPEERPKP